MGIVGVIGIVAIAIIVPIAVGAKQPTGIFPCRCIKWLLRPYDIPRTTTPPTHPTHRDVLRCDATLSSLYGRSSQEWIGMGSASWLLRPYDTPRYTVIHCVHPIALTARTTVPTTPLRIASTSASTALFSAANIKQAFPFVTQRHGILHDNNMTKKMRR